MTEDESAGVCPYQSIMYDLIIVAKNSYESRYNDRRVYIIRSFVLKLGQAKKISWYPLWWAVRKDSPDY